MPYEPDPHPILAFVVSSEADIGPHHLRPNCQRVVRVGDVDGQCHGLVQAQGSRATDKRPHHAEIHRFPSK
jgi:hypothetical protein